MKQPFYFNTYFQFSGVEEEGNKRIWTYQSREYGNVGDETPGEEDFQEAKRLAEIAEAKGFKAEIGIADEWTFLDIIEDLKAVEITLNEVAEQLGTTPQNLRKFLRKEGFQKPGNRWIWNDQKEVNKIKKTYQK